MTSAKELLESLTDRLIPSRAPPREARARRLLLVDAGTKALHSPVLEALHAAGFTIRLLLSETPSWQRAYVQEAIEVDFADEAGVLRQALEAHQRQPADGVMTFIETRLPLTARLAEALALRFYPPKVAERASDKWEARQLLASAGLRIPRVQRVDGTVAEAAAAVGLPAVYKPVRGEGAVHVWKVDGDEGIATAQRLLDAARADEQWPYSREAIVESFVAGTEHTVESVVRGGQVLHAAVLDEIRTREPAFESVCFSAPSRLGSDEQRVLMDTAAAAITALGLDNCVCHTELRLSSEGAVILEVAGRLASDRIPEVVRLAHGVDLARAAADTALGVAPLVAPQHHGFAAVGFFVPAHAQVQERSLEVAARASGLRTFAFWGRAGVRYAVAPEGFGTRLGYCLASGDSHAMVTEALEAARTHVEAQTGLALVPFR